MGSILHHSLATEVKIHFKMYFSKIKFVGNPNNITELNKALARCTARLTRAALRTPTTTNNKCNEEREGEKEDAVEEDIADAHETNYT